MGFILLILMAVSEIVLILRTCLKEKEKQKWRKNRMITRMIQMVIVMIAFAYPAAQKWRFIPVLCCLIVLLLIAVSAVLIKRKRSDGEKTISGTIASGFCSFVLTGLFLVPAFVFTGYSGLPVTGEYRVQETSAILVDRSRTDPFEQDGSFREVPVHFYYPETTEGIPDSLPLVVFSHGAFGYYQSNTSTYMELAGNGYVVVSMDHPHHSLFTQDTAGNLILVDEGFIRSVMEIGNSTDPNANAEEKLSLYQDWMELRTADIGFVLDAIETAKAAGEMSDEWFLTEESRRSILSVLNNINMQSVGLMGHSMGGAASAALGRERDDVSAVIDLDGTMLAEYADVANGKFVISDQPYELPILEFVNWETRNQLQEYLSDEEDYPNTKVMKYARAGFSVILRDTKHMDFTDLPLLSPLIGKMLGSGERDKKETMMIVNSIVLDFFDCYLKGEGGFSVQEVY
ncbi:MAG: hypothetical protein Q4C58_10015 [Eubacteriales bacterium]|nr:hypothetical protein [Eubacteriales bacterium]